MAYKEQQRIPTTAWHSQKLKIKKKAYKYRKYKTIFYLGLLTVVYYLAQEKIQNQQIDFIFLAWFGWIISKTKIMK